MDKVIQIKKYIIKSIETGLIKGGDRLPSCRKISIELGVNKITVNKAYKQLEDEHIVYCVPRGGFYVVDSPIMHNLQDEVIDFATMAPDEQMIPHTQFLHAMNTAVDIYKRKMLGYNTPAGLVTLRNLLKTNFENQGVYSDLEQIVITNGAQQAIFLSIDMLLQNGGRLLAESPTYDLFLKYVKLKNIDTVFIERKETGYDFKQLERIFKHQNIAAFYIIPRHHNPTGYSLSEKDKLRLVELAYKYNVILIEDDYLADIASSAKSLPIYYYDINDITIYIRSFSKSFMPGIRLGAVILPKQFATQFTDIKYLTDLNTSTLSQASLEIFIKSGMYEKQVIKVKKLYTQKSNRARDILSSLNTSNIKWFIPKGGLFIWIQVEGRDLLNTIENIFTENNITFRRGEDFFRKSQSNGADNRYYIRLCLSSVSMDKFHILSAVFNNICNL